MPPPSDLPSTFDRVHVGEVTVDRLVTENLPRLQAFVRAHLPLGLGRRETDADLLQSICADLLAQRAKFDFRSEPHFRAWMFTAARNKMLEKLRFHGRQRRAATRESPLDSVAQAQVVDSATPSRAVDRAERARLVQEAILALSPEHREIVTLIHFAGLSPSDTAEHLGRSVDAARMLHGRALAKLAKELERRGLDVRDLAP